MSKENIRISEKNKVIRTCVIILFFMFIISACILGLLIKEGRSDRSIGGFIDLSPDYAGNTKFVIIGGRVFYPDREAVNYTFPLEVPGEDAVEIKDDASLETITLRKISTAGVEEVATDSQMSGMKYYKIIRNRLGDNRSKDFRNEVKQIELLTVTGNEKDAWTQESDIDLFRNDDGKLLRVSPGSEGYFRFQINNKSGQNVHAVMTVSEPEGGLHLPMVLRLEDETSGNRSDEAALKEGNAVVLSFDIDKDDSGIYRLDWKWPYESGDDEYDGTVGSRAGKYILNTTVYAETVD